MTGIYKITNPFNKIYVGQSKNIIRRFKTYKTLNISVKTQTKLFESLIEYGFENHNFEVIEECEICDLNERERYWQEYYNVLNHGLNSILQKTKHKKGEWCEDYKINSIGKFAGEKHPLFGKKHSKESKLKMSIAKKGKKHSLEAIEHRRKFLKRGEDHHNYGKKMPDELKSKLSKINTGRKQSKETIHKRTSKVNKIILNTENGVFHFGYEEVHQTYGINKTFLCRKLTGYDKNNTRFIKL